MGRGALLAASLLALLAAAASHATKELHTECGERGCARVFRPAAAAAGVAVEVPAAGAVPTVHTVVATDCTRYFTWCALGLGAAEGCIAGWPSPHLPRAASPAAAGCLCRTYAGEPCHPPHTQDVRPSRPRAQADHGPGVQPPALRHAGAAHAPHVVHGGGLGGAAGGGPSARGEPAHPHAPRALLLGAPAHRRRCAAPAWAQRARARSGCAACPGRRPARCAWPRPAGRAFARAATCRLPPAPPAASLPGHQQAGGGHRLAGAHRGRGGLGAHHRWVGAWAGHLH